MKPHPHAKLARQYWKEAETDGDAWKNWQWSEDGGKQWNDCNTWPSWAKQHQYRRKPRPININGHEVPEPCREPLANGMVYYCPHPMSSDTYFETYWDGSVGDVRRLKSGLIHIAKEAALIHAKALISFTASETPAP